MITRNNTFTDLRGFLQKALPILVWGIRPAPNTIFHMIAHHQIWIDIGHLKRQGSIVGVHFLIVLPGKYCILVAKHILIKITISFSTSPLNMMYHMAYRMSALLKPEQGPLQPGIYIKSMCRISLPQLLDFSWRGRFS